MVVIFLLSVPVFGAKDGHEKLQPTRLRRLLLQKDEAGDVNVGGKLGRNRRLYHHQQEQMEEEITDDIQRRQQEDVVASTSMSLSFSMSMSMVDVSTSQPSDGRTDVDVCPQDLMPMMPCGPSYPVGTVCEYDFQFDGCSWEELKCDWINQCVCTADSGLNGDSETGRPLPPLWFCVSFARQRCPDDTTPVDLPRGPCDPDQPIPVPP